MTHCAAAGIAVTCAGAMTGDDLGNVLSLPDTTGLKNEVIIQKGHAVNFGAPVTQMIRMSGATAVEFGEANRALPEHMARAINANTAAAVFRALPPHRAAQPAFVRGIRGDCGRSRRAGDRGRRGGSLSWPANCWSRARRRWSSATRST